MANPFAKLFGFGTPSTQQRPSERPLLAQDTALFGDTSQAIKDALARRGTGYTPDLFQQAHTASKNVGRSELQHQLAAGGATASARGLGRSSVVQSQDTGARRRMSETLASQDAAMRERSQQQELAHLGQARGQGLQGVQIEGNLAQNRAQFEQNVFDAQSADRVRQDQEQQAGLMRTIQGGLGFLGGGFTPVPGGGTGFNLAGALGGVGGTTGKSAAAVQLAGLDDEIAKLRAEIARLG